MNALTEHRNLPSQAPLSRREADLVADLRTDCDDLAAEITDAMADRIGQAGDDANTLIILRDRLSRMAADLRAFA